MSYLILSCLIIFWLGDLGVIIRPFTSHFFLYTGLLVVGEMLLFETFYELFREFYLELSLESFLEIDL
jgi:hypothetical protein